MAQRRDACEALEQRRRPSCARPTRCCAGLIDALGIDGLGDRRRGRPRDHYGALVRSIVGQQLSTKAARAIYGRLTERFGGRTPTPEEVLADDPDELRTAAGLSHAKVGYLRSLAEHVLDGSLELNKLGRLPDERGDRRAGGGQGHRRLERAHVPDVPPRTARCARRSATSGSGAR